MVIVGHKINLISVNPHFFFKKRENIRGHSSFFYKVLPNILYTMCICMCTGSPCKMLKIIFWVKVKTNERP